VQLPTGNVVVVVVGQGKNSQLLCGSLTTKLPSGHCFTSCVQIGSVVDVVVLDVVVVVGQGKNSQLLLGSLSTKLPSGHSFTSAVHVGSVVDVVDVVVLAGGGAAAKLGMLISSMHAIDVVASRGRGNRVVIAPRCPGEPRVSKAFHAAR